MIYQLQPNRRPLCLQLDVTTDEPRELFVSCYDRDKPERVYLKRTINVDGNGRFYLNMPLTPKRLKIALYDNGFRLFSRNNTFHVNNFKRVKLRTAPLRLSSHSKYFKNFAEDFCQQIYDIDPGVYPAKDGSFRFQVFSNIPGTSTPARIAFENTVMKGGMGKPIQVRKNDVQIDKGVFTSMTLPRNLLVLLHEYSHNFLSDDPSSEIEADKNALSIYLASGYPFVEAIYTYTNILNANDNNVQRVEFIDNFCRNHNLFIDNG